MIDVNYTKVLEISNTDNDTFFYNLSLLSQDQRLSLIESVREFINEKENYEMFSLGFQPQLKIKKEIVEILTSPQAINSESKISKQIDAIKKIFSCWISSERVLAEIARIRYPNTIIVSQEDRFYLMPAYDETDLW